MSTRDTILHNSTLTPDVELRGACTILDSVVRGAIKINARAVLSGVEVSGRGTFYGRVAVIASVAGSGLESQVEVGPGVKVGAGVRILGHGVIRGDLTIEAIGSVQDTYPLLHAAGVCVPETMPELGAWEDE